MKTFDNGPPPPSARTAARTIAAALGSRDNGFGLLRLGLAWAVLLEHSFPLGGFGENPFGAWVRGQDTLGGVAVAGFFLLSGYLVTKSALGCDPLQFLWRRALRIYPAFLAVLLLTAFVLGPLVGFAEKGSLRGYLQGPFAGPLAYLLENLSLEIHRFGIYDLLETTTPYGHLHGSVFNGSLWTLAYEWRCYVVVLLLAAPGLLRRFPAVVPLLALFFWGLVQAQRAGFVGQALDPWLLRDQYGLQLTALFLCGGALAALAGRLPLDDRLGLGCLALFLASLFLGGLWTVGYPAFGYALLWLAARLPPALRQIGQRTDLSYGIYVWAFPLQQLSSFAGLHHLGWLPYLVFTTLATGVLAWLSWHFVESPALSFKDRGAGRGLVFWRARLAGVQAAPPAPPP